MPDCDHEGIKLALILSIGTREPRRRNSAAAAEPIDTGQLASVDAEELAQPLLTVDLLDKARVHQFLYKTVIDAVIRQHAFDFGVLGRYLFDDLDEAVL